MALKCEVLAGGLCPFREITVIFNYTQGEIKGEKIKQSHNLENSTLFGVQLAGKSKDLQISSIQQYCMKHEGVHSHYIILFIEVVEITVSPTNSPLFSPRSYFSV